MPERRNSRSIALCIVATLCFTGIDLWTKDWATENLSSPRAVDVGDACVRDDAGRMFMQRMRTAPTVLVDGYLELRYAENCGAAFGMLNDAARWIRASLFTVAAVAAVVVLMWMYITGNGGVLFAASVPLIVSGAIGNLVDRVRLGYVVDFVRFHLHDTWEWPTFNFADATITVGVAFLLLDGLRRSAEATDAPPAGAASTQSAKR